MNATQQHLKKQSLKQSTCALVLIDLQGLDVDPEVGALASQPPDVQDAYLEEIWGRVIPNAARALSVARSAGIEVIHVRIQSATQDGRDRSPAHKRLGLHVAPGSAHAQFLEGVEPQGDELIINKTTSDAFHSTTLAYILRNIGITELYMLGVFTNECVASTARSACDLGFTVSVLPEACAAVSQAEHESALATLDGRYAELITLSELGARLGLGVSDRLTES